MKTAVLVHSTQKWYWIGIIQDIQKYVTHMPDYKVRRVGEVTGHCVLN